MSTSLVKIHPARGPVNCLNFARKIQDHLGKGHGFLPMINGLCQRPQR